MAAAERPPSAEHSNRAAEGVRVRHLRACATHRGRACSCKPGYQAQVWSPLDGKPIRKTFGTLAEAKAWRQESQVALRRGMLRAPSPITLRQAADAWLAAAKVGVIRTRSGDPYKPSALRAYQQALNGKVPARLAGRRLTAVTPVMLQDLIDELVAAGLAPSTIRNAILPLRAIFRRAHSRGDVATNPTLKLALPAVRGRRDRIARPHEAERLIQALPLTEQAVWATAFYAGLRMGELQALQWAQVDLDHNLLRVERSWDPVAGFIDPKSRSGKRNVPLTKTLRTHLLTHRLHSNSNGFVFPNSHGTGPFNPSTINDHAKTAWKKAGLTRIGLHECRHTYAAYMIAAGINPKALSTYMGHSSITITLDRYGHLLPGNEHEAATLLDTWLRQTTRQNSA